MSSRLSPPSSDCSRIRPAGAKWLAADGHLRRNLTDSPQHGGSPKSMLKPGDRNSVQSRVVSQPICRDANAFLAAEREAGHNSLERRRVVDHFRYEIAETE